MKRKKTTKIGDIFAVKIDDNHQRFFQYIVSDITMLNSSVIRVFKKEYLITDIIDWNEVVKGEVDFYTHTILRVGLDYNLWELVANVPEVGDYSHVWFRDCSDHPQTEISQNWYVWRINQNFIDVGRLPQKYHNAEIGVVVTAWDVVERIKTGKYLFKYPGF